MENAYAVATTTTIRILATPLRRTPARPGCRGRDVASQADAVRARASLTGQFASAGEDPTGAENLVMIARLPGHPRWRAKTRAGELLEASGLAEAAGRSGRTRAVSAGGWPSRLAWS